MELLCREHFDAIFAASDLIALGRCMRHAIKASASLKKRRSSVSTSHLPPASRILAIDDRYAGYPPRGEAPVGPLEIDRREPATSIWYCPRLVVTIMRAAQLRASNPGGSGDAQDQRARDENSRPDGKRMRAPPYPFQQQSKEAGRHQLRNDDKEVEYSHVQPHFLRR